MVSKSDASPLLSRTRAVNVGEPRRFDPWIIFTYVVLVSGILIAVLPFFWMVSTSLMTLGEATGRTFVP